MSLTHSETVIEVIKKADLIASILMRGHDAEIRNLPSLKTVKILEVKKHDVSREAVQGDSRRFDALGNTEHVEAEKTSVKADITC